MVSNNLEEIILGGIALIIVGGLIIKYVWDGGHSYMLYPAFFSILLGLTIIGLCSYSIIHSYKKR